MYSKFGMDDFVGLATGEMKSRPVPQVFRTSDVRLLTELYAKWMPYIIDWVMPQIKAPYQTFNKTSRVGWPGFHIPDNKREYVSQFTPSILAGDLDQFREAFIIMNVRCQAESKNKDREFLFVDDDDTIRSRIITAADREVKSPVGPRIASRTRLVFNLPIYNLVKQAWDTAVHNVFLKWPAFHHDLNNGNLLPVKGYHICYDISHFERHTADCNRLRSQFYGGVYAQCGDITSRIPFAVPTASWNGARFLYPKRAEGWSDQYASGDSAVSPSQKEIMMAVYCEFFHAHLGHPASDCCHKVASGGDERLTIRNYGDDNSIDGDQGVIESFMQFVAQYLTVGVEDPPRFLGFQYYPKENHWRLAQSSYLTKVYSNERAPGSRFRRYPYLGWVAKRDIYRKIGHPTVASDIYPVEDQLLDRMGLPWYEIVHRGDEDRQRAFQDAVDAANPLMVMEKEYAMSPKEQIAAGTHQGIPPEQTRDIIMKLVGKDIQKRINP